VQARERADDFQVAQFLGTDVHQEILALRIVAIQALDGILHRRGELAVRAAELLEEHVPKSRICIVDIDGDESRHLLRFDRIGGVDGTRSVYHYCSVMLFASSGYRGIAPMIACAWVEPLTRSDAEREEALVVR